MNGLSQRALVLPRRHRDTQSGVEAKRRLTAEGVQRRQQYRGQEIERQKKRYKVQSEKAKKVAVEVQEEGVVNA